MTYAQILSHPVTRIVRTFVRRTVMVCAVILAVTFVTTISADLGPALRTQAEERDRGAWSGDCTSGTCMWLWDGSYIFEDLMIEGLKPESLHRQAHRPVDALAHAVQPPHRLRHD